MPFVKGKPKTGGRKKIACLKETVGEILIRTGCNPIEGMALLATDKNASPQLRLRAFAELAQYQFPKRRAIEVSGIEGAPIELNVSSRELLLGRIASLAARRGTGSSN